MKAFRGRSVSLCTRIQLPIQLAWEGLHQYLKYLEGHPGETSLHVSLSGPVRARLDVPIKITTADGNSRSRFFTASSGWCIRWRPRATCASRETIAPPSDLPATSSI